MLWGGRRGQGAIVATEPTECPMPQANDLSRCLLTLEQDSTLIAAVELSQASWLVAGIVPAVERQPLKKIEADEAALLRLLGRWTDEATGAGRGITRVCVAFEAGRDGFWLARWLRARGVEAHVIHPTSVAVPRGHRRAKTDRLDTELLKRAGRWRSRRRLEPWAGCAASEATAAWPRCPPWKRRTPGAPTASGRAWSPGVPGSSTASAAAWPASASAGSGRPCAGPPNASRTCARRRGTPCRRTPWPNCGATWRACASSGIRSRRSRPRVRNGCGGHPPRSRTRWCSCWHV